MILKWKKPVQLETSCDPTNSVVLSVGHSLQTVCPISSWYVPFSQSKHLPDTEYVPIGQSTVNKQLCFKMNLRFYTINSTS